jgi:glutathione S-transferase
MEPLLMPWLLIRKRRAPNYLISNALPAKRQQTTFKPQFRLISFCSRDLAEPTRLIFAYAGIDYEDITIDNYKLFQPELSPTDFPMLDWNGKLIRENDAIARMLARMYGLAGDGYFEQAKVDTIIAIMKDLSNSIMGYFEGVLGFKIIDKETMFREVFQPSVNKHFATLEKYASQPSTSGFFFDSGVTYADFSVANMVELLNVMHPELMVQFPSILLLTQRVFALPNLQYYLSKRPVMTEITPATSKPIMDFVKECYPKNDKCLTYMFENIKY